jgi:hypothetical protein
MSSTSDSTATRMPGSRRAGGMSPEDAIFWTWAIDNVR